MMEDNGRTILKAVQSVRKLMQDIARLLGAAEGMMQEAGWDSSIGGGTATAESSVALSSPERWIPYYAFRFFTHPQRQDVLAFVSVILDDPDRRVQFEEPLVSMGLLEYEERTTPKGGDWDWWFARLACWTPEVTRDGEVCCPSKDVAVENASYIRRVYALALPLAQVNNGDELKENVVDPFLVAAADVLSNAGPQP